VDTRRTVQDDATPVRGAALEAGAGRPFRFSLEIEEGRARLAFWLGGRWALGLGLFTVAAFVATGSFLALLLRHTGLPPGGLVALAAAAGSAAAAAHLRTRTVRFERRDGTWGWFERRSLGPARWSPLTDEAPLLLERESRSRGEDWTLYAGRVRLFTYLGDPSIRVRVVRAFEDAGFPLRSVVKR